MGSIRARVHKASALLGGRHGEKMRVIRAAAEMTGGIVGAVFRQMTLTMDAEGSVGCTEHASTGCTGHASKGLTRHNLHQRCTTHTTPP